MKTTKEDLEERAKSDVVSIGKIKTGEKITIEGREHLIISVPQPQDPYLFTAVGRVPKGEILEASYMIIRENNKRFLAPLDCRRYPPGTDGYNFLNCKLNNAGL